MKHLLFFPLLFTLTPPVLAATDCYEIGNSSFCKSITRDGQLSLVECYWKGDNKFCKLNATEPWRRVY